jgi:hypothetical protein
MARIEIVKLGSSTTLVPRFAIVVEVAAFRFGFGSLEQLRACIDYYSVKTHPSSRLPNRELAADLGDDWREQRGWEVERWFERLPMYLLEEPKRKKVLKALQEALQLAERDKVLPSSPERRYDPLVKR